MRTMCRVPPEFPGLLVEPSSDSRTKGHRRYERRQPFFTSRHRAGIQLLASIAAVAASCDE